jgi:phosphate/sulfate permease
MRRETALGAILYLGVSGEVQGEPMVFPALPVLQVEPSWGWVLGAAAVALVIGFMLGWRTLDRRIRKKYGGLRIY